MQLYACALDLGRLVGSCINIVTLRSAPKVTLRSAPTVTLRSAPSRLPTPQNPRLCPPPLPPSLTLCHGRHVCPLPPLSPMCTTTTTTMGRHKPVPSPPPPPQAPVPSADDPVPIHGGNVRPCAASATAHPLPLTLPPPPSSHRHSRSHPTGPPPRLPLSKQAPVPSAYDPVAVHGGDVRPLHYDRHLFLQSPPSPPAPSLLLAPPHHHHHRPLSQALMTLCQSMAGMFAPALAGLIQTSLGNWRATICICVLPLLLSMVSNRRGWGGGGRRGEGMPLRGRCVINDDIRLTV